MLATSAQAMSSTKEKDADGSAVVTLVEGFDGESEVFVVMGILGGEARGDAL
jgi:hypothetical protein